MQTQLLGFIICCTCTTMLLHSQQTHVVPEIRDVQRNVSDTMHSLVQSSLKTFVDSGTEFSELNGRAIPSTRLWINKGAEIVDGDENTNNVIPPRLIVSASNTPALRINTPVIKLNRIVEGTEPSSYPGGDVLESLPIDLHSKKKAALCFSYYRTERHEDYARGWSDSILVGPEVRVIRNSNPNDEAPGRKGATACDELQVDFMCTTDDGSRNVFDDTLDNTLRWTIHPRTSAGPPITDNAAYTVFGGGGIRRGYDESNPDSALTRAEGLRSDIYDDGKDEVWKQVTIQIPDIFLNAPNEASRNFRMRFKVAANNHSTQGGLLDDDDNFFIKDVRIVDQDTLANIKVMSVVSKWPYESAPRGLCKNLELDVKIANCGLVSAQAFDLWVEIHDVLQTNPLYRRRVIIPFMPVKEVTLPFPSFSLPRFISDSTKSVNLKFLSLIFYPGGDSDSSDDSTSSHREFVFNDAISYLKPGAVSDVNKFAVKFNPYFYYRGLSLRGYRSPEYTLATACGDQGGSESGQFAVKFNVRRYPNTIDSGIRLAGFQAYFVSDLYNEGNVRFHVYKTNPITLLPGERIEGSQLRASIGFDNVTGESVYDTLSNYVYEKPLVIHDSIESIWVSVSQLSSISFNFGASSSRSGFQITNVDDNNLGGEKNCNLNLDKRMRKYGRSSYGNEIFCAFENGYLSGNWQPFNSTIGNLGYAHNDFQGTVKGTPTYTRGSWIPILQPLFVRGTGDTISTSVHENDVELTESQNTSRLQSHLDQCTPMPAENYTDIHYSLATNENIRIDIVDCIGRKVCELVNAAMGAGAHVVRWNIGSLDKVAVTHGVYQCRLYTAAGNFDALTLVVAQ